MKRKGKPDPYAYIPLDKQMLNKRYVSYFYALKLLLCDPCFLLSIFMSLRLMIM